MHAGHGESIARRVADGAGRRSITQLMLADTAWL